MNMNNMFKCVLLMEPLLNIQILKTLREIGIFQCYMHVPFINYISYMYRLLQIRFHSPPEIAATH